MPGLCPDLLAVPELWRRGGLLVASLMPGYQRIDVLLDRRIDVELQMFALRRPSTQSCYNKRVTINGSHDQFIEQRLRLFQIARVKSLL